MTLKNDNVWAIGGGDFSKVLDSPYQFSKEDIGKPMTGAELCDALPGYFITELEALLRKPPEFIGFYEITSITDSGVVSIDGVLLEQSSNNRADNET